MFLLKQSNFKQITFSHQPLDLHPCIIMWNVEVRDVPHSLGLSGLLVKMFEVEGLGLILILYASPDQPVGIPTFPS